MVDGDSKPFSIERCRELLGTEDSGLSDEEIEAIRDQTGASVHVLIDIYLDQQGQGRAREVARDERGSIPVWFGKWISLEINVLAGRGFQAIEPLNLRACMRLPVLGNLVDQIFPRWNRVASWLRDAERFSIAA